MRSTGSFGHQPDPDGGGGGEVAAERAGEQHLLDVAVLEAELLEQQRPAGRDRGLGELQLADVALGEVRRSPRARRPGVGPVQHEDPLLPPIIGEPVGERRARPPWRRSSGTKRPEASSSPTLTSSATASTRPEPHRPARLDVADHAELDVVVADLDDLDRAVGGPHAAADRAALERRAGRRRGREDPVAVAEHDLAVGADVDEQPGALVAVHAGGEHAGDDVAADVRAERGEERGPGPRVQREAEVGGEHGRAAAAVDMMNGATPSGSGSMPSASAVIVALPASATS